MMRFSKKVEYALIALLYIANKNNGELTTARELSDKFDISLELIGKILQRLAKSGLILSVQGVKGGYYLSRSSNEIKISLVVKIIDGPIALTDCIAAGSPAICERGERCLIRKSMENIQSRWLNLLDQISLNDFQETYAKEISN
jgi:Rrf2 family protein